MYLDIYVKPSTGYSMYYKTNYHKIENGNGIYVKEQKKNKLTNRSLMPRSHIHGSPHRIHYGLNLTDNPGNAVSVV